MRAKHTAGPWTAEESEVYSDKALIAETRPLPGDNFPSGFGPTELANARLIAASPSMYEFVAHKAADGDLEASRIVEAINASR